MHNSYQAVQGLMWNISTDQTGEKNIILICVWVGKKHCYISTSPIYSRKEIYCVTLKRAVDFHQEYSISATSYKSLQLEIEL